MRVIPSPHLTRLISLQTHNPQPFTPPNPLAYILRTSLQWRRDIHNTTDNEITPSSPPPPSAPQHAPPPPPSKPPKRPRNNPKNHSNHTLPPRPTLETADLKHVYLKGSGPGGQKINKTSSAVQLTHLPTGIVVKSQATRSRRQNHDIARRILAEKVEILEKGKDSRVERKRELEGKRKGSADKKKRRKYRRLEEEREQERMKGGEMREEGYEDEVEEGELRIDGKEARGSGTM